MLKYRQRRGHRRRNTVGHRPTDGTSNLPPVNRPPSGAAGQPSSSNVPSCSGAIRCGVLSDNQSMENITMRRFLIPAIAVTLIATCSTDASAFGLLDKLCGKSACDACCDVGPTCGCEVAAPACGCEVAGPACGCEVACGGGQIVDACGPPKRCFLDRLFHKSHGCDAGCAAAPCEPVCGCEMVAAPTCGCEVMDPCGCDSACAGPSCGEKVRGFFGRLFHKSHGCDAGCAAYAGPTCGCEIAPPAYVGPTCGCEVAAPTCGCEPTCGF